MPRLRQAVLAARDLDAMVELLQAQFGLGVPYHDPLVAHFGLQNAVFAVGGTFLEVVSPVNDDAPAARQLDRAGAPVCGYMAMLQVEDLAAARARAAASGLDEVFAIEFDDIAEVHLHPAQIGGAIVSLSEPRPPESWRWGGEGWTERQTHDAVTGITVAVRDPDAAQERWEQVAGGALDGVAFVADARNSGIVEIVVGTQRLDVAALAATA